MSTADLTRTREWRRETANADILVSTSMDLLDREWINRAFETADIYWGRPLSAEQLDLMLRQSLTLGMYKIVPSAAPAKSADSPSSPRTPSPTLEDRPDAKLEQIGMARFVTDYVTFAYLTDVYILPEYRKDGLGKWLVNICCKEVIDNTPQLRRALLLTSPDVGKKFYERELGWREVGEEREYLACMTIKGWGFGKS